MQHTSATISSFDGSTLFTRQWTPDVEVVARVFLVHGVHEHSGRYAYVASSLMQRGVEVHAIDLRGHGQSEGERATVGSFAEYSDDVAFALRDVLASAEVPVFLLGHSMGGLVVSRMIVDHGSDGLAGLVLSSPALAVEAPAPLRALAPLIARWLPRVPVTALDLSRLSRDPRVEAAYREDPLCTKSGVRAHLGHELLRSIEHVRENVDAFTLPMLLFHGTADTLTSPAGSAWMAENAPSDDVTLTLYDGFYHETLNELERDRVIDALSDWILSRASAAS